MSDFFDAWREEIILDPVISVEDALGMLSLVDEMEKDSASGGAELVESMLCHCQYWTCSYCGNCHNPHCSSYGQCVYK